MSGPKVVRVRTREERAAECFSQIDGLRASIELCEIFARHHDLLDSAAARRRKAVLEELLRNVERGAFEAVASRCRDEQVAVEVERDQIERTVLERAAAIATRRRRTLYLAEALAQRFETSGQRVPPELQLARNLCANDTSIDDAERFVSAALTQQILDTSPTPSRVVTDAQRQLAESLGSGVESESLSAWAARKAAENSNESGDRLERLIAEADALDRAPTGRALIARATALRTEPDSQLRTRQIDSMLLEWAQRRSGIKLESALRIRARKASIELMRIDDAGASGIALTLNAVADQGIQKLEAAVATAESYLSTRLRHAAAEERRRAVLSGLASLGYEVGAELATATPKGGRIVVRKPDRPGYGVEIMAPENAERMQVKVVAVGSPDVARDTARDRDAETLWCSDFSRLQELLQKAGAAVVIEKALPVGATPLSCVSLGEDDQLNIESSRILQKNVPRSS